MRRLIVLCLIACGLVVAPHMTTSALAQWDIKRSSFDPRVVARYKAILERNPDDKGALRKLQALYKERYKSIQPLLAEYEAALAKNPRNAAVATILGHLEQGQGNSDKAVAYYEQAVSIEPARAAVQLILGDLYRRGGKSEDARRAYQQALASTTSAPIKKQVLRALAELSLDAGDMAAAQRFFEQYLALAPGDVQTRLELADALAQHGQYNEAIGVLKEVESRLRSDPARRVEVITRLGAAYEAGGDEEAAIREYQRAIAAVGQSYYLRKELITRIIDIYRRRQALPDLITQYESSWPAARRGYFEWDVLARLYEEIGNQEKALAAYRKATAKAPYELDTQRRLIALLENSGREDQALTQYEAVIRVAPGEPRFQLELAERYWRRGKEKAALALLAKMERRFPGDAGVHAAVADLYSRWGKGDLALKAQTRLTQIEPGEIAHLVNLGEQHFQRNDKKKAIAIWNRIINQKTPASYARLGEVYAEHDMLVEAMSMYNKAIKLEPGNAEHYKGRAAVHERRRNFDNFDEAIADWEKVLELIPTGNAGKPARREARTRIVNLLKRSSSGLLQRRIKTWQTGFQTTPPDIEAGYFLVEAHLRERRYSDARIVLERLLTLDSQDLEAMHQLVKVYKHESRYDKAVTLLLELAKLSPGREREYYNEIAEIKTAERKDSEALDFALKALEKSPNDPVAYQRLAERYIEMQRFDKAVEAYEKTIELNKRNFRVYFALARLYTYQGTADKAAELYREVLRQATDEETLVKAGREAIALEEMTGTLGDLERVLAPLAFTFSHNPVYRRILVELYSRYVNPHLIDQWSKGGPSARAVARAELDRLGTHGLKPLLEALNDDSDLGQQRIAVDVLGYLGNKGAAAPLVRLAQKSSPLAVTTDIRRPAIGTLTPVVGWEMRVQALIAAGRLGDPRTIDALIELSKHRERAMRDAAIYALGRTGHRDAIPALVGALDGRGESVATLACLGLANIGDARALARLSAVVANRRGNDTARAACAFALGHIGQRSTVPVLIEALAYGNSETPRLAAWALGRMGATEAVPALLRAYFSRHEPVRQVVGWSLARILGGTDTTPSSLDIEFVGSTTNELAYDAEAAVRALPGPLDEIWPSSAILIGHEAELTAGLREALGRHRDLIVRVLEDLGATDPAAEHITLGPLTRDLATLAPAQRTQVLAALSRVVAGVFPELVPLTRHRDPSVRKLVLAVLSRIDTPQSKSLLQAGMDDGVAAVRLTAMRASATYVSLFDKHGAELAQAVAARLASDSWRTRRDAAASLGHFDVYADEAALIAAIRDANAYVREQAVVALGRLGRASSIDALLAASTDELATVRLAVVRSIATMSSERVEKRLRQLAVSDPDRGVAEAARAALGGSKN